MTTNKEHWNDLGGAYSSAWRSKAKQGLSAKETRFIQSYVKAYAPQKILEIGVGNGRILASILSSSPNDCEVYGIDISEKMATYCKNKFAHHKKLKNISVQNISKEPLPDSPTYDFVVAIRVLKYNPDWKTMVGQVASTLKKDGVFVFSQLNKNSISRYGNYEIPTYPTTTQEIKNTLSEYGLSVCEMSSFTRLPDIVYEQMPNSSAYASIVNFSEHLLHTVLGRTLLGRMLFVAAKKTD